MHREPHVLTASPHAFTVRDLESTAERNRRRLSVPVTDA